MPKLLPGKEGVAPRPGKRISRPPHVLNPSNPAAPRPPTPPTSHRPTPDSANEPDHCRATTPQPSPRPRRAHAHGEPTPPPCRSHGQAQAAADARLAAAAPRTAPATQHAAPRTAPTTRRPGPPTPQLPTRSGPIAAQAPVGSGPAAARAPRRIRRHASAPRTGGHRIAAAQPVGPGRRPRPGCSREPCDAAPSRDPAWRGWETDPWPTRGIPPPAARGIRRPAPTQPDTGTQPRPVSAARRTSAPGCAPAGCETRGAAAQEREAWVVSGLLRCGWRCGGCPSGRRRFGRGRWLRWRFLRLRRFGRGG